ncbi:MAG: class I SAM-dependent methyltransferase [Pseudomonadota bacterium]
MKVFYRSALFTALFFACFFGAKASSSQNDAGSEFHSRLASFGIFPISKFLDYETPREVPRGALAVYNDCGCDLAPLRVGEPNFRDNVLETAQNGGNVIEFGCGLGRTALKAITAINKAVHRDFSYTVNDIGQKNLEYFKRELNSSFSKDFIESHINIIHGNAFEVFENIDQRFDTVYSANLVHYFSPKQVKSFFQGCYKILKPGGKLYIIALTPYPDKISMKFLKDNYASPWDMVYEYGKASFLESMIERAVIPILYEERITNNKQYQTSFVRGDYTRTFQDHIDSAFLDIKEENLEFPEDFPGWNLIPPHPESHKMNFFSEEILGRAIKKAGFEVTESSEFSESTELPEFELSRRAFVASTAFKPYVITQ